MGWAYRYVALKCDKRTLEVLADTNTGDDLKYNNLSPGRVDIEVNIEPESQSHHEHAKPDLKIGQQMYHV